MNKKFLGKKGQGAMEYLMTYGWAILVVMIVGVVLWQLGIFNLGGTVGKTMSGFSALRPLDWSIVNGATNDDMIVVNGEGVPVTVTGLDFDTSSAGVTCGAGDATLVVNIAAGDSGRVENLANDCTGSQGTQYSITAKITYNKTIGTINQVHTSVGTLKGVIE